VTLEEIVIAIARVAGSLLVLRWAFVGGVIAILIDLSDLFMMNLLHLGGVRDYQTFDKWLDQVYLACFLIVALRWPDPARRIAVVLYAWRAIGFVLFEATHAREILVLFPNLFEFWFLFVASLPHWRRVGVSTPARVLLGAGGTAPTVDRESNLRTSFGFTRKSTAVSLVALLALKEVQEFALHWFKVFDGFTAVEAVQAVWDWLTAPFS
jgi:hypothetical protein